MYSWSEQLIECTDCGCCTNELMTTKDYTSDTIWVLVMCSECTKDLALLTQVNLFNLTKVRDSLKKNIKTTIDNFNKELGIRMMFMYRPEDYYG